MSYSDELKPIYEAIQAGDKDKARTLLKSVLYVNPTADAYVLAAQATDSQATAKGYLEEALKLDADHAGAKKILAQIQAEPSSTPGSAVRKEGDKIVRHAGTYEMLWDCRFCGTEKLLGVTHRHCPNCGATQDPEWRYYPSDEDKIAVEDHVYVGTDIECPACSSLLAGNVEFCPKCGSPQTDAARAKVQAAQQVGEGQKFGEEDLETRQEIEFDAMTGRESLASEGLKKDEDGGFKLGNLIIIAVIVAVVGGIIFALTSTQDASAYVTDFRWERQISIEEMRAVSGSSDCGREPQGAYNIDRRREQVDTRRVADGESCERRRVDQGDGTFREERVCETIYREEPVMGDVCYYKVNRWQNARSVNSQGDKDTALVWPELNLSRTGNCVGCEREGNRSESFILVLRGDDDATYECPVDKSLWESTTIESTFTLQISTVGGGPRCNTLEPVQ